MLSCPFAIYRLPYANEATMITQTEGEPEEYLSCTELNGKSGFVIAPFHITPDQPILLIQGETEVVSLDRRTEVDFLDRSTEEHNSLEPYAQQLPSSFYSIDFANYHSQLKAGSFRKIVLARCADERLGEGIDPMDLFFRACELYPRMFISLVSTRKSGIWLTATPEILLEGTGNQWRTIALAGTMKLEGDLLSFDSPPYEGASNFSSPPYEGDLHKPGNAPYEGASNFSSPPYEGGAGVVGKISWSPKNLQEQRIVSTYIAECLEQFTDDFREEGPRTVRAANLVHLRSDFTFTLPDNAHLGNLLHALHPTPAVCGLPKREAFDFIIRNEHTPRRYYSGFMGPLNLSLTPHPSSLITSLFVSLRCMNIEGNHYHLFAGGGLLPDSTEQQEWLETEAKLETMRQVLDKKTEEIFFLDRRTKDT